MLISVPANSENDVESPLNLNSSKLNPSVSTSNGPKSPKINDMRTPKRPVYNSSPSSDSTKQRSIHRSARRKSSTSDANVNSSFRKLEESPLVKHSNGMATSKLYSDERNKINSPVNICTNNNQVNGRDEFSDYFNDSINELMIQCSQAVESKLNKENSDLNLLDDSSNDLILQCTQQVEQKLIQQNVINRNNPISTPVKSSFTEKSERIDNSCDIQDKSLQSNTNVQPQRSNSTNTNTKRPFIPKQANNLHKLDSPVNFPFDYKATNNISSMNKQFMTKGYNQNHRNSPSFERNSNSNDIWESSSKSATKHFLSPTTRHEASSKKKFCHNNNIVTSNSNQGKLSC